MNLRTKLLAGFCGVALMSMLVGVIGLVNMRRIDAMTDMMYETELLGLNYILDANVYLLYAARAEKSMLLAGTMAERERFFQDWKRYIAETEKSLLQGGERFNTPEGIELVAGAQTAFQHWLSLSREVFSQGMTTELTATTTAIELSMGQAREMMTELDHALTVLGERKEANAERTAAAATALYHQSVFFMTATALGALLMGVLLGMFITNSIVKPVNLTVNKAKQIAQGDLSETIPDSLLRRKDELGTLANAFHEMNEKLNQTISDIIAASDQVLGGSEQLSSTSQVLSQGATEQSAAVEQISASMEEMSSTIRQNADNAGTTETIARKSTSSAEEGSTAVIKTVEAMKEIADKITIIEEIARSTNMLALNASIEAARAGEYGKGFAVVASEVGKLAERSHKEASEINELSRTSVEIANQAGENILTMIPEIRKTAELVQEISASSMEQNTGAEQITQSILQLDQVIQNNASAAEESASMAEELAGQAGLLRDTVSYFKLKAG